MEGKKKLSTESNLGPLTIRGNGQYAYNSEGVMEHYSKRAWREQHWTVCLYYVFSYKQYYSKHACYYVCSEKFQLVWPKPTSLGEAIIISQFESACL